MGEVTVTERFALDQFVEIFDLRDSTGNPYLLIGGQAVNFWAERYSSIETDLTAHRPFRSRDIDFKGNRSDVIRIAQDLKRPAKFPDKVAMTALAGAVTIEVCGHITNIEIVRIVPGVTDSQADATAVIADLQGKQLRVLNPVLLTACKLELAFTISQEERQDLTHLRIMIPCVRGFMRELLADVESGAQSANNFSGAANAMWKLATSARGKRATRKFGIQWPFLPMKEISSSQNSKIIRFREMQLSEWRKSEVGKCLDY
jgi:hypothetical protein